jgi:hypothetical protein
MMGVIVFLVAFLYIACAIGAARGYRDAFPADDGRRWFSIPYAILWPLTLPLSAAMIIGHNQGAFEAKR